MSFNKRQVIRMIKHEAKVPKKHIVEIASLYPNIAILLGSSEGCLGDVTSEITSKMREREILIEAINKIIRSAQNGNKECKNRIDDVIDVCVQCKSDINHLREKSTEDLSEE